MPKAGFYAVESGRISLRRDGNWYSDEERIDNARIALLFSRSIRRAADGGYFLQVGDERAPITVEDTPYVVKAIDGDARGGFSVVLNDDEREALELRSLEISADNVLYCSVKDGKFRARFLRPAYYHLSRCFEIDADGNFWLAAGGERHPIKAASKTSPNAER